MNAPFYHCRFLGDDPLHLADEPRLGGEGAVGLLDDRHDERVPPVLGEEDADDEAVGPFLDGPDSTDRPGGLLTPLHELLGGEHEGCEGCERRGLRVEERDQVGDLLLDAARHLRQRVAEVLDLSIDAAAELFAERGYDGTSIRDITRQAGTNIGAVTYHFETKQRLYEAVVQELVDVKIAPFRHTLSIVVPALDEARTVEVQEPGSTRRAERRQEGLGRRRRHRGGDRRPAQPAAARGAGPGALCDRGVTGGVSVYLHPAGAGGCARMNSPRARPIPTTTTSRPPP